MYMAGILVILHERKYASHMWSCYNRSMSSWEYQDQMVSQWPCYNEADDQSIVQLYCSRWLLSSKDWQSRNYDTAALLPMLVWSKKPYFLLQKCLGILFCENKNNLAPQWYKIPTRAICWYVFENLIRMLLVLHWALSNCLWPLWDSFHTFKIKITYTPYIFMLTSTLEVPQKYASHPHKNNLSLWHDSSCCKNNMGYAKEKQKKNIHAQKLGKKEKEKEK